MHPPSHLPRPAPGVLTAYVVGPGFGESVVVVLPDTEVVVVDSCTRDGHHLTLAILDDLEIERVDLLVVTHPDLDHLRGLRQLVEHYPPRKGWRYPGGASLRELVAHWVDRDHPKHRGRLAELLDAMTCIEELENQNRCVEASYRRTWRAPSGNCAVECVAPSSHDIVRARKGIRQLVERRGDDYELGPRIRDYLTGDRSHIGDRPNLISLAVVVRWGERRLLLAGDVEATTRSPHSGWAGVLGNLEVDGELHLLTNCDAVKVAHHGSEGALHYPAWDAHAKPDQTTVAVVTPFQRGAQLLPDEDTLMRLRSYVANVGITANLGDREGDVFTRAESAGWTRKTSSVSTGPVVTVAIAADGHVDVSASSEGQVFG